MPDQGEDRPTDLAAAVADVLPGARADLERLVRIPSIWADPARADDTRRSAEAVAALARDAGGRDVRIVAAAGGAPAVIAHWPAPPGAPTVLLYAHHDVQPDRRRRPVDQPAVRAHRARRAPLRPRRGRRQGRRRWPTSRSLRAYGGRPPVGVTLFVEGEEESGSPTLTALLRRAPRRAGLRRHRHRRLGERRRRRTGADHEPARAGRRDVEVAMLERQAHSGVFGGPVGDALTALCRTLASLHDERGDVAVPGLVTGTTDAPDPDVDTFRADAGLLPGVELIGTGSVAERSWLKPAVAVLGIDAPRTDEVGERPAAARPRRRRACGWRPATTRRRRSGRWPSTWRRTSRGAPRSRSPPAGASPSRPRSTPPGRPTTPPAAPSPRRTARRRRAGLGGSIPFIAEFARTFPGAAVLVTGVGDPASRWHGIDESLHLEMFGRGVHAEALLLAELAPDVRS